MTEKEKLSKLEDYYKVFEFQEKETFDDYKKFLSLREDLDKMIEFWFNKPREEKSIFHYLNPGIKRLNNLMEGLLSQRPMESVAKEWVDKYYENKI